MHECGDMNKKTRYSIVTPARNEEAIINQTVESVINQTIKPKKWIIMNDGSTDRTGEILKSYSKVHDWIEVMHVEKKIASYGGIQQKLQIGFKKIDLEQNDFIGKLDADIELKPTYYEDIMEKFRLNPKLGIAGGTLFVIINNKEVVEENPPNHVRGGVPLYRVECWKDIGGMDSTPEYDSIDLIKANMLGWETKSFDDIKARHYRPTSHWNTYAIGKGAYLTGYHPLFLVCKSLKCMVAQKPYILAGVAMTIGFFRCYLKKPDRVIDDKFIKFLRKKQMERLFNIRLF